MRHTILNYMSQNALEMQAKAQTEKIKEETVSATINDCLDCEEELEAGGPGSGRHPEGGRKEKPHSDKGTFRKGYAWPKNQAEEEWGVGRDKDGYNDHAAVGYDSKKGTHVEARTGSNWAGSGVTITENGHQNKVFRGSDDEAHSFMKQRYGIHTMKRDLGID